MPCRHPLDGWQFIQVDLSGQTYEWENITGIICRTIAGSKDRFHPVWACGPLALTWS